MPLNHSKSIKTVVYTPTVHFLFGMAYTVGIQQFYCIKMLSAYFSTFYLLSVHLKFKLE